MTTIWEKKEPQRKTADCVYMCLFLAARSGGWSATRGGCSPLPAPLSLTANTPDVVVVDEESREESVLEMACTFDLSLEEAFMTKVIKYQPLLNTISELGYRCRLFVFIFGSLGHTHRLVVRGFQQLGMPKKEAKKLAKYCSVSAIIGSRHIWRRRCYLYP